MNATTQLEMVNVNAKKTHVLGNQQPSSFQLEKVQRLSGSAEYTQVGGKREQPVHSCKDCGTTDISAFGIRSDYNRPWNYCRKCRQLRNRPTQVKRDKTPAAKAMKKLQDKKYAEKNAEKLQEYQREYQSANREKLIQGSKDRYNQNKDRHLMMAAKWKKENAGKVNQTCMKRHAAKIKRVPNWLTEEDRLNMDTIYNKCREMNDEAGFIKYHVDHIFPLQGKIVSGLHVPQNLQILLASVNCSKQNKVDNIVCSASRDAAAL